MTMNPPTPKSVPLLTADEFLRKHSRGHVDLVRGVVKELPMPGAEHGRICIKFGRYLDVFAEEHDLGQVMGGDTFVRIPGDPATVRGADVLFISYAKLPKGQKVPEGILEIAPELIVEVRSPSDPWTHVFAKVNDYFKAGVTCVVVANPARYSIGVYRESPDDDQFGIDDMLTIPDILPGFSVPVRKLFE